MFAIAMILFTLAAGFGCLVLIAGCLMLISRKLRRLGAAVVGGGSLGALAAFALFAFIALIVEAGREPIVSVVSGAFTAAGFGAGSVCGIAYFAVTRRFRFPNRWADRRRVGRVP
jgi:hypothetical protein